MANNDVLKGVPINSRGFGTISKLVMQDRNLHITAKALYAYLNSYSGSGDVCFPSVKKICYDLNISRDTLNKYLNQLMDFGYIVKEQVREQGKFSHNTYVICSQVTPKPKTTVAENIGDGIIGTDNIVADKSDTKINSIKSNRKKINNVKNNNQSINLSCYNNDKMDTMNLYNKYLEIVKNNIDYDNLVELHKIDIERIDEIVNIMVDIIAFNNNSITISGTSYPAEVVRSQFLKLDTEDISYVLYSLSKNTSKVTNIKKYLIACLYNSKNTRSNFWNAEVRYDLYGNCAEDKQINPITCNNQASLQELNDIPSEEELREMVARLHNY